MALTSLAIKKLIQLDKWLDRHCTLCFFLLLITVLRIPTFFEPYWNPDQSLFLMTGNILRSGSIISTELLSNPLVYISLLIPNLLALKIVQYIWLCLTFISLYTIVKKISAKLITVVAFLFAFLVFTVLPILDLKVTNGEFFLIGFITMILSIIVNRPTISKMILHKKRQSKAMSEYIFSALLLLLSLTFLLSNNTSTSLVNYYTSWLSYIRGNITKQQYYQTFSENMQDTYDVAKIIKASADQDLLIVGDNPNLYALSATIPTSKYLTASEIDSTNAQNETLAITMARNPTFIIIMKDNGQTFTSIQTYIHDNYVQYKEYEHFYLHRKYKKS